MVHLSRLAEDLIILCGEGHHFFELSDALSTGSSMMPQKKNPDPLELVRGKTGRVHRPSDGAADDPEGPAERVQQGSAGRQAGGLRRGGHARGLLSPRFARWFDGLTLDRERAARAASGMLLATDVADYLVRRGLPFRRAHEVVGGLVRKLLAEGREFDSLSAKEWRAVSELFDADIAAHVTPKASVAAKRTPQSTAPAAVERVLADVRTWLDENDRRR